MADYSLNTLFGIPLYHGNTRLDPVEVEYLKNQKFNRLAVDNGYSTVNKQILRDNPNTQKIKQSIEQHLLNYLTDCLRVAPGTQFEMVTSWVVKHDPGDWSQEHDHTNSVISGVLYLDCDEHSGNIVFHRSTYWQNLFPRNTWIEFEDYKPHNSSEWKILPKPGDILFFPSQLVHSVEQNKSQMERYALAFNFYPRGKLGNGDCEVYL